MTRIFKNLIPVLLIIALSVNSLTASFFAPKFTLTDKIEALVDTPYEIASRYMPVLEKAIGHCKVPFKAKKLKIERYVYESNNTDPLEKLFLDVNIERKGLLGQLITAEGKLNDWDLSYTNNFKFSILGKGTMEVESLLDGKPFSTVNVFANKRTATADVFGELLGKDFNYITKDNFAEGILDGHNYKIDLETIKDKKGNVVAIRSKGKIGDYIIEGHGYRQDDNSFVIEENYGPLTIKTFVKVIA